MEIKKNVKKVTKKVLNYELDHIDIYGRRHGRRFSYRTVVSYHKDAESERYSDWEKVYPEVKTREDSVYTNKGTVTISDDLGNINVVNENQKTTETEFTKQDVTTREETDYVVKEIITPVRAYKVMDKGGPDVNHYYRIQITSESEAYTMKAVGGVRVKYITNEGKELKTEIVREVGDIYELNVYNQYSGNTKVGERRVENRIDANYDTTVKQYPTLKDAKTGFTYEYVGLKKGSPAASGKVVAGITEVIYEYRLVSEEEKTPSKTVETKGSVVAKYVDTDGNEIKDAEKVVTDAVVKTTKTYTTKSGDVVVSTRDEVENHEVQYNTAEKKVDTITKEGKKYNYQGIYAPSEKFHNVAAETGKVVEGITTIVYRYQLETEKVQWEVSQNPPKVEVPEYNGGVVSVDPPVNEKAEYQGGASLVDPPTNEVLEYTGGANSIEPPVLELEKYPGGKEDTTLIEPPIYTKPTLIITKWVDENGNSLKPADVKSPIELGQPNEAFDHGSIEGYEYLGTIRNQDGDVVTHVFRKLNSESRVPNTPQRNSEKPKQEEQKVPEVTPESPKNEAETPEEIPTSYSVAVPQANQLPQTGTGNELAILSAATSAILAGLGITKPRKKQ